MPSRIAAQLHWKKMRGYRDAAIPSTGDSIVLSRLNEFGRLSPDAQSELRADLTIWHALTLRTFAERMATYAVRSGRPEYLFDGLRALALAYPLDDDRESSPLLGLYRDAALRTHSDLRELGRPVATWTGWSAVLDNALACPMPNLARIGYRERFGPQGFEYVRLSVEEMLEDAGYEPIHPDAQPPGHG